MRELKLIVAGGRDFHDYQLLTKVIMDLALVEYADRAISIVSGMAKGADSLGYMFAVENNVRKYIFPADWRIHNKFGRIKRYNDICAFGDCLVLFLTQSHCNATEMLEIMANKNKPVFIVNPSDR